MSNEVNGLKLVSAKEAGYEDKDIGGDKVLAVLIDDKQRAFAYCLIFSDRVDVTNNVNALIPLPKPKVVRPYKAGEVRCGMVFTPKNDHRLESAVVGLRPSSVYLGFSRHRSFAELFDDYHLVTYDAQGNRVLSVAGVEE